MMKVENEPIEKQFTRSKDIVNELHKLNFFYCSDFNTTSEKLVDGNNRQRRTGKA
jgi:hypothetical protein